MRYAVPKQLQAPGSRYQQIVSTNAIWTSEHSLYTSVWCGHPQPHPHIHAAEPLGDMTAVEGRGDRGDGCLMNVR